MIDDQFAWRLAAELVRIESTDPGTYEDAIEKHIKQLVERHVATLPDWLSEAIRTTELEALPDRRDLMVRVAGTGDEPALIYSCHMDTVTLGDGWDADIDPLGGLIRDDRLYGRGACDMKGGDAVFLVLARHLAEHVEKLHGNLLLSFNPVEETLHRGIIEELPVLRELQKQHDAEAADRKSQIGTGDRSEKIRTYNFPEGRVTDHRIKLTLYKLDQIMNGDLNELIDSLIAADQTAKLAQVNEEE